MMGLFLTNMQLLSSRDVNWWTGVVWIIVMFLSAVWTLILTAPIHCRASIGECNATFHQIWREAKLLYTLRNKGTKAVTGGTFSKGTCLYLNDPFWYLKRYILVLKVYIFEPNRYKSVPLEKVPPQWQLLYLYFWECTSWLAWGWIHFQ